MRYNLSDICELITDYVANGSFQSLADNVQYLNTKDYARLIRLVDYGNNYSNNGAVWVSRKSYDFLKKSKLFGGEIIISNVGANLGTVFLCPKLDYAMTLGPNCIMIKTNDAICDQEFLYYYLLSKEGHSKIMSIVSGSAMPKFNKTSLRNLELEIPELEIQRKIVRILSALDQKIELNNLLNQKLNNIGLAIYDNYSRKTKKSIKAKEKFLFKKGTEPGSSNYRQDPKPNDIRFIRVGDMLNDVAENYVDINLCRGNILSETDVAMSFDATIGRVSYGISGGYSSGIKKVYSSDENISNAFIYYYLNSDEVQKTLVENATGTTILHASKAIDHFELPYDELLIEKTSRELGKIFNKQLVYKKQNVILSEMRDTLLPKLMSGEINLDEVSI